MFEIRNQKQNCNAGSKQKPFLHLGFEFVSCFGFRASCFAALAALAGCGAPVAEFRRYETFAHKVAETNGLEKGFTRDQLQGLDETMQALFGTPDDPAFPAIEGIEPGK